MERRRFLLLFAAVPALVRAQQQRVLRGKLTKSPTGAPALQGSDGRLTLLDGDPDTIGVLKDARLAGIDFEVVGEAAAAEKFKIAPIHTRALFTYKNGQRRMVTYWCEVCAIRTYSPGICWCCRDETALDLLEPDKVEKT
ncbi:MAG TPA: hypothetical protein VER03_05115 [Bryobacteraceae bacterium]|nr:hypothetical protein [Bryobacteraceae bacterium]